MRNFKTTGVVIKRRNVGEADRLLTIFTKHHGKITVKAKGVRKISSRRSGHIELLNLVNLSLYKGHSSPILTEATAIENYEDIKSDLKTVGLAYHICELIDSLCAENQENTKVYSLLLEILSKLEDIESQNKLILDFEKDLLTALGFSHDDYSTNTSVLIEQILERRLKTKRMLPLLS